MMIKRDLNERICGLMSKTFMAVTKATWCIDQDAVSLLHVPSDSNFGFDFFADLFFGNSNWLHNRNVLGAASFKKI